MTNGLKAIATAAFLCSIVYEGGSHGLAQTEADRFNADVLDFTKA